MFSGNTKLGVPHKTVSSIKFTCFNDEEIRKLSVKRASNPFSFDSLNRAVTSGLYDASYGPISYSENCETCLQYSRTCTGHSGHIELPLPVYNPLFIRQVICLLQASCQNCKKFYAKQEQLNSLLSYWKVTQKKNDPSVTAKNASKDKEEFNEEKVFEDAITSDIVSAENEQDDVTNKNSKFLSSNWTRHTIDSHLKNFKNVIQFLTKQQSSRVCSHCKSKCVAFGIESQSRVFIKDSSKNKQHQYVTPSFVRDHLNAVWKNEKKTMSQIFDLMVRKEKTNTVSDKNHGSGIDVFFLDTLFLPASRFRPAPVFRDRHIENVQTAIYAKIVTNCKVLSLLLKCLSARGDEKVLDGDENSFGLKITNENISQIPGNTFSEKIGNSWQFLQQHVNMLFDSDMNPNFRINIHGYVGIRQCLEKKQGLFRQNMMGKRVNFAARSVISPDPYIATNEIGIPFVFASKFTYPTAVTSYNIRQLRQAVINGPKGYPGAVFVIKRGHKTFLSPGDRSQRIALSKQLVICEDDNDPNSPFQQPNIVGRYLETGDILLLNRQPTLHRGSIMAHKARVLPNEKTLRLHYANCKSYNADFDGDEMNAHFPQSELGRAEAMNLMLTDQQYLSAKDGKPLSCLIQDHIVAGVHMSLRGRFFRENEYHILVYSALFSMPFTIKLLPPTLIKPQKLWSGKQILSTLLINIIPANSGLLNLHNKSKISRKDWSMQEERRPQVASLKPGEMCESEVVIRQGELLCGILDKAHYGASEFGLIHALYEVYGGSVSGKMLTSLARLFTTFLQLFEGFTLGVADILTTIAGDNQRTKVIEDSKQIVSNSLESLSNLSCTNDEELLKAFKRAHNSFYLGQKEGKQLVAAIDHSMKMLSSSCNDQISSSCTGKGLLRSFPHNNLQLMVRSGAKGGLVNCLQISCSLGQIDLEGKRPGQSIAGRTCPSFKPFDTSIRAGGFVSQRFLTGLRPQEYFFHCMAGREGLVDTAVKTSNSGYLQRCLVKSLESLVLSYDMTVRDNDGVVVQFLYGEDGVNVEKSPFLQYNQYGFLMENLQIITKRFSGLSNVDNVVNSSSLQNKWKKYSKNKKKILKKASKQHRTSEDKSLPQVLREWKASKHKQKDPIISQYRPDLYFGAVSECFFENVSKYLKSTNSKVEPSIMNAFDKLETVFNLYYQRSLCDPGENVGLLAAQSVGEPSTQMTLNTFHFAGRGEMNVTLGIPRLREILMFCSRFPSTPHITIPVLPGMVKAAEKVCKKLSTISLGQVVEKYAIEECLTTSRKGCTKKCILTMHTLSKRQLMTNFGVRPAQVLHHVETKFVPLLLEQIAAEIKKAASTFSGFAYDRTNTELSKKSDENNEESEMKFGEGSRDDYGGDVDDDDAGAEIMKRKKNEEVEYEEEADDAIQEDDENRNNSDDEKSGESDVENEEGDEAEGANSDKTILKHNDVIHTSVDEVVVKDFVSDESSCRCDITINMPLDSFNVNLLSVVRALLYKTYLRKTKDISRCMLVADKSSGDSEAKKLIVDGSNLGKVLENQHCLDVNRLYTNHVAAVMNFLGIEAARRVIEQEVVNVFAVYGIEIDRRHLTLLSDYMCNGGAPEGCHRNGIRNCSSAFQKITFEIGCRFISQSALHGFTDNMDSPSANMITGQPVKAGTGSFTLLQPMTA